MTRLIFLDTETTGLDPERHEVWEVAFIIRDGSDLPDREFSYFLPVRRLHQSDPFALNVGKFWERWNHSTSDDGSSLAARIARTFRGAVIVGAVPDFDVRFLTKWLAQYGQPWTAHYHLCDVENLAVGFLASELADARRTSTVTSYDPDVIVPPWSSDALAKELGVTINESQRHTALGDARWARDMYDAVMGGTT